MPKVKHGTYELGPFDADLQAETMPLSPITARPDFGFVTAQITAAKMKAVAMVNGFIGAKMDGGTLTLSDFNRTKEALDPVVGKYIPVEWRTERPGAGRGDRAGTWTILIDMDDVPDGAAANGPDRPHVGFSYWYKAINSAHNVSRVNGHVFINSVPASRNSITERAV
jgi:hypothetical protein